MVLITQKPTRLPPPRFGLKSIVKISAMLLLGKNIAAQTSTTFTTTNLKVTDTLTSVNMDKASEIVASETITAKDDIVAEQDIRITGALTVTSTATFKSTINADQGINFGGNSGMRFLGTNSSGHSFLRIGENTNNLLVPPPTPIFPTPASNYWWMQNYGGYLKTLQEVEAFYLKNKHLPDVPSEKEVKENGISTADMDATLLQKIEELYLHVVELNKKVEMLQKENQQLKNK